ncbi:MAG: single-stranded DNA-binding protein [Endomicrobium sp.]|jgi:single-strand DNA-binding protein|nr:single-stranded DNA-binding protein [Endomicrobium sp.]
MNNNKVKFTRLAEENIVILVGRLTQDAELRRTNLGVSVCSFTIAISKRIKDLTTNLWKNTNPTFVPIVIWREQAEKLVDKLKKGIAVHVQGQLKTSKWIDTNGKVQSRLEVIANRVQCLSIIKNSNNVEKQQNNDELIIEEETHNIVDDSTLSDNDTDNSNEEIPF